jgi:CCR4-NOT complex subunit CAF16
VLLLDEITVDLDVLARADLMAFLKRECEQRGAVVIYATHIFDGLESWPSHLAYVASGRLQLFKPAAEFPELAQGRLLDLVERCAAVVLPFLALGCSACFGPRTFCLFWR